MNPTTPFLIRIVLHRGRRLLVAGVLALIAALPLLTAQSVLVTAAVGVAWFVLATATGEYLGSNLRRSLRDR